MSQTPSVPPIVNKLMKRILRSPLHGVISKDKLLISFTGYKTGKTYTTPVSYSQNGDHVYIFTHGTWWKNLCGEKPVALHLRGQDVQGTAESVVEDKQLIAEKLAVHLSKVRSDASFYSVTFDEYKKPKMNEVEKAVETVVMIRVRLNGK